MVEDKKEDEVEDVVSLKKRRPKFMINPIGIDLSVLTAGIFIFIFIFIYSIFISLLIFVSFFFLKLFPVETRIRLDFN